MEGHFSVSEATATTADLNEVDVHFGRWHARSGSNVQFETGGGFLNEPMVVLKLAKRLRAANNSEIVLIVN